MQIFCSSASLLFPGAKLFKNYSYYAVILNTSHFVLNELLSWAYMYTLILVICIIIATKTISRAIEWSSKMHFDREILCFFVQVMLVCTLNVIEQWRIYGGGGGGGGFREFKPPPPLGCQVKI